MIDKIKFAILFAWNVLVPRFITEDVALRYVGDDFTAPWSEWDDWEIACSLDDVQPGESFDGIATVDAFQFLGIGITYSIGNFRPWGAP